MIRAIPTETPFYYRVTAYNAKGTSAPSVSAGPVSAQRNFAVLVEPEITGAVADADDITVSWTAAPGATGYILYRSSALDDEKYIVRIDTGLLSYTESPSGSPYTGYVPFHYKSTVQMKK